MDEVDKLVELHAAVAVHVDAPPQHPQLLLGDVSAAPCQQSPELLEVQEVIAIQIAILKSRLDVLWRVNRGASFDLLVSIARTRATAAAATSCAAASAAATGHPSGQRPPD